MSFSDSSCGLPGFIIAAPHAVQRDSDGGPAKQTRAGRFDASASSSKSARHAVRATKTIHRSERVGKRPTECPVTRDRIMICGQNKEGQIPDTQDAFE
jgi:hypothetical protein